MAKKISHHHHNHTVIHTIAASNTWLIGMLLLLGAIIIVAFYHLQLFKAVKGVSTFVSPTPSTRSCMTLRQFDVEQPCGPDMYQIARFQCFDGKNSVSNSNGNTFQEGRPSDTPSPKISSTPRNFLPPRPISVIPSTTPSSSCKPLSVWYAAALAACQGHTSCSVNAIPTPSPVVFCNLSKGVTCPTGFSCLVKDSTTGQGVCVAPVKTPTPTVTQLIKCSSNAGCPSGQFCQQTNPNIAGYCTRIRPTPSITFAPRVTETQR